MSSYLNYMRYTVDQCLPHVMLMLQLAEHQLLSDQHRSGRDEQRSERGCNDDSTNSSKNHS